MTSRFVSGGIITGDNNSGGGVPQQSTSSFPAGSSGATTTTTTTREWDKETANRRNAEWEAVQRDLEADRRRREEAPAKQAAFEEKARLSNQFRALDDDEIDFLEGVRDERRVEEERVKRETEERLASFRQAQKATTGTTASSGEAEGEGIANGDIGQGAGEWVGVVGKKRKRLVDKEAKSIVKGVKRRPSGSEKEAYGTGEERSSDARSEGTKAKKTGSDSIANVTASTDTKSSAATDQAKPIEEKEVQESLKPKPKFGLVDYGSDEDDDD
ncbi:hypothetical protein Daesc_001189 [Daldinia eschscholtzii]|uniref:FAM192A/Fyv6 N-terminal domain-containing protein n=1 Tax=Daldinia eschscholtzii TaxID=292717 RepID=A0AAX6N0F0_9PEZI